MKIRYPSRILFLLAVGILTSTFPGDAQRAPRGKVTSLQATSDQSGPHPATAEIAGPATIMCINATSETPNPPPLPNCRITAPGFSGVLNKGQTVDATGAGTVTLRCNGQGYMRCNARIDIPPAAK
jgi:hypothetical protein